MRRLGYFLSDHWPHALIFLWLFAGLGGCELTARLLMAGRQIEARPDVAGATPAPGSFHGYECTENCEGHEAGYQWAEDNEITDGSDCSTPSDSFNEGCAAWVEEHPDEDAQEEAAAENEDAYMERE